MRRPFTRPEFLLPKGARQSAVWSGCRSKALPTINRTTNGLEKSCFVTFVSLSTWEGFGPLVKSFMTENVFVDTNVLIYAHDADSGEKHQIANDLVQQLLRDRTGVLSTQILEEFYAKITRKMWHTIPRARARELLSGYAHWLVEVITPADVVAASELEETYQLSFWDALVIVTARNAEVARLLSEDFQHGQTILGVRIENPFRR